ncbi:hypothetical protein PRIPAC_94280, partial [Pristionchus pacificus]
NCRMNNLNFPPPDAPSINKNCHVDVTNDLRHHLAGKLLQAILPSPDRIDVNDQRTNDLDLIQYSRKVEKKIFETADDREEYYHVLAEKIYKLQKEMRDREQQRLAQAAGQNG